MFILESIFLSSEDVKVLLADLIILSIIVLVKERTYRKELLLKIEIRRANIFIFFVMRLFQFICPTYYPNLLKAAGKLTFRLEESNERS